MTKDEYIDHELRIRILEHTGQKTVARLNALITIAITGFALPMLVKYFSV